MDPSPGTGSRSWTPDQGPCAAPYAPSGSGALTSPIRVPGQSAIIPLAAGVPSKRRVWGRMPSAGTAHQATSPEIQREFPSLNSPGIASNRCSGPPTRHPGREPASASALASASSQQDPDGASLHPDSLHCTALHCPALHCTVLYCTSLLCPGPGQCSAHDPAIDQSPAVSSLLFLPALNPCASAPSPQHNCPPPSNPWR